MAIIFVFCLILSNAMVAAKPGNCLLNAQGLQTAPNNNPAATLGISLLNGDDTTNTGNTNGNSGNYGNKNDDDLLGNLLNLQLLNDAPNTNPSLLNVGLVNGGSTNTKSNGNTNENGNCNENDSNANNVDLLGNILNLQLLNDASNTNPSLLNLDLLNGDSPNTNANSNGNHNCNNIGNNNGNNNVNGNSSNNNKNGDNHGNDKSHSNHTNGTKTDRKGNGSGNCNRNNNGNNKGNNNGNTNGNHQAGT